MPRVRRTRSWSFRFFFFSWLTHSDFKMTSYNRRKTNKHKPVVQPTGPTKERSCGTCEWSLEWCTSSSPAVLADVLLLVRPPP